jgi:flavin reductase (DIM6/NTAB) family NADH-FMN oxidoreductase RutF
MSQVIDQVSTFKQIMGSYPTGVTIVTTLNGENKPVGLTANSFASVSIDPLMVLWSIDRRVSSFADFMQATQFAVHVLASDQAEACWAFAGKELDRFSKVSWQLSDNSLPIIDGSLGVMECKTVQKVDAGDHVILIGEVISLRKEEKDPMLYYSRNVGPIPSNWPE